MYLSANRERRPDVACSREASGRHTYKLLLLSQLRPSALLLVTTTTTKLTSTHYRHSTHLFPLTMHSAGSSSPVPVFSDIDMEPAVVEVCHWWADPVRPGSADISSSAIGPVFDTYFDWPHGTYDHADFRRSAIPPYTGDMIAHPNTTPPSVMCPLPSPVPVYIDALARSSYAGRNSGQVVQQYPPDAVATSASGGMNTQASEYSSLTNWAGAPHHGRDR